MLIELNEKKFMRFENRLKSKSDSFNTVIGNVTTMTLSVPKPLTLPGKKVPSTFLKKLN